MKKIAMLFVPVAAIGFAVPASAQTIVIRDGMHRNHDGMYRDRGYCARAQWRHRDRPDYGRRHHRGPVIVIQR